MSPSEKTLRKNHLHVRLDDADMDSLQAKLEELGLTKRKGVSRYIRTILRSGKKLPVVTDDQMSFFKFHFTNVARIGGLINRIVYLLNTENMRLMGREIDAIPLDPAELKKNLQDLHAEVVAVKKALMVLASHRME